MAKYYWSTVDDFIQNGKLTRANTDDLVEFEGFNNSSDGYTIYFHKTGAMGVASQSPTERGDNSLTDALGYVWEPTRASTAYYDGVNLNFPAPFGSDGVGIYTFIGTGWQFVDQAIPIKRTTSDLISATGTFENDVENTTGFYTAGDSGGAQWKATSTTGLTPSQTPSDRGAAELVDGSGRLWIITRDKEITPYQLGARGDGATDDAAVIKTWLDIAGDLYAPDGDFVIDNQGANTDGVFIDLVRSISVRCSNKARFVAKNNLDGDLLRFEVPDTGVLEDVVFTWRGGVIDQREQANSTSVPFSANYPPPNLGTTATSDGISVIGVYNDGGTLRQGIESCHVDSVTFIASDDNWETAGGDSGCNLATANDKVTNCTFIGHRDLGVYHSSDDNAGVGLGLGESFTCSGNTFKRCMFGVSSKRGSDNISISGNTFKDCVQWIATEPFSKRTASVAVTGNVGSGYIFGLDLSSTDDATVTGNVLKNAGILLNGDVLPTVNFTNPQAITLNGVVDATVAGNTIKGKIPEYSVYTCEAIALTNDGTVDSDDNLITSNIIKDIDQPITGSMLNNSFELNKVSGTTADEYDMAIKKLNMFNGGQLTIASGVITASSSLHNVDTEADAATDDLETINGGKDGMRLVLKANNSTRTVVVKDAVGNIQCAGDFSLTNQGDFIELIYDEATSFWYELTRSDNAA